MQDLSEPKPELPCLVSAREALHLSNGERVAVIPCDIEVRGTAGRSKGDPALGADPLRQGVLRRRMGTEPAVDFVGVDRKRFTRLCRRRFIRWFVIREDLS